MWELKFYRKFKKETYSEYKAVKKLSIFDIQKMFEIYEKYYQNTSLVIFTSDLSEKTGVFLIREPLNNQIVGFSTITEREFEVDGKSTVGFFSGDTVIESAYWGSRALQRAMFRYVMNFKIRYFLKPVYWLLISKGFKTYLLMANNFNHYYPHPDGQDQHLDSLVKAYSLKFYSEYYDHKTSLINFGKCYQALKSDVAPITDEMKINNPKIAFFEKVNPTWKQGTELPCIAEIRWLYIWQQAFNVLKKFKNHSKGIQDRPQVQPENSIKVIRDEDKSKAA